VSTVKPRAKKREIAYSLPAADPALLAEAQAAFRAAVEHERHIAISHAHRHEWYDKLDEFDRRKCNRETETYFAEYLRLDARHVFCSIAGGMRPDAPHPFHAQNMKRDYFFTDNRERAAVAEAVASVRKKAKRLPLDTAFVKACELAAGHKFEDV
jgi:hypothetical protein